MSYFCDKSIHDIKKSYSSIKRVIASSLPTIKNVCDIKNDT